MKPAEDEPSALLCFGPWLVVPGGCAWRFGFARRQQGVRPMPVWLGAASPCAVRQASPCAREWLPVQPSGSRVQVGLYPWQAGSGALPCSAGCWTEPRKWNSVSGWRAALSGGVAPREGHRWLCLPPLLNWLHDLGEFSYPCCILLIFWRCMLFLHFDISEIRVHFTNIIP